MYNEWQVHIHNKISKCVDLGMLINTNEKICGKMGTNSWIILYCEDDISGENPYCIRICDFFSSVKSDNYKCAKSRVCLQEQLIIIRSTEGVCRTVKLMNFLKVYLTFSSGCTHMLTVILDWVNAKMWKHFNFCI